MRRHDYEPFGAEWPQPSGAESGRFTGKPPSPMPSAPSSLGTGYGEPGEYDDPTGLYYFGARYLRPDLGRFTTVDPVYTWSENLNP